MSSLSFSLSNTVKIYFSKRCIIINLNIAPFKLNHTVSNVVSDKIPGRLGIRGMMSDLQVHVLACKYEYQTTPLLYLLLDFVI